MNDFRAVADRVEIQALQAEFTDAAMMRDRARLAALFTPDGVLRMPDVPVELTGPEQIRVGGEKLQEQWEFFVQNTHPGTVRIDGDTATGRAHVHEVVRLRDDRQGINYAIYHDRYRRTPDGWRFTERVYEIRYLDTSPLAGSAPGTTRPSHTAPATEDRLQRAAAALAGHGFGVEILDDAKAARARVGELLPPGASVLTTASETLRLSGIEEDVNGRPGAVKPRLLALDREREAGELRRLLATPDTVLGSVTALVETGTLVIASGTGSQLPAHGGGAGHAIWVVGAQKLVPDLPAALRRVHEHALPLESARTEAAYGQPSAVNQLLVLHAPPRFTRGTVLLLREAVGY
ncbi:nuclear transport factor 2 family protein [Kitasatospora phosalacinea]|uniref:nuclear transport factor 2 family protein n=1 Tax=Kitasatospora phosalacinea TaxID=2065 RepID=UPI0005240883|nr:nuclear transport factor 2 family protein [Kitasatospora phosalacinea]